MTDHSAFYMSIQTSKNDRGAGYWKMNTDILNNDELCEAINTHLKELLEATKNDNILEKWESVKCRIALYIQDLCRNRATEDKIIIGNLCEKVAEYEASMPLNREQYLMYIQMKQDLDELYLK